MFRYECTYEWAGETRTVVSKDVDYFKNGFWLTKGHGVLERTVEPAVYWIPEGRIRHIKALHHD